MIDDRKRMEAGLIYDPSAKDIMDEQAVLLDRLYDYNHTRPSEMDRRNALLKEMLGACGEGVYIEPPFYANWAGAHVFLGDYVYANFGLTIVDDGNVYIGDKVMIAPNVCIATANHPINARLRDRMLQYNKDVHIGRNTWIGAGSVIVPGVTIGEDVVIGAGSVVTRDIPDGVVAFGNPCRVIREVGERDEEFFYRDERIDWDAMEEYLKSGNTPKT